MIDNYYQRFKTLEERFWEKVVVMETYMKNFILKYLHFWKYRNPADRTCRLCRIRQQKYVMAWEGTNWMRPNRGWWETVDD